MSVWEVIALVALVWGTVAVIIVIAWGRFWRLIEPNGGCNHER